MTTGSDTRMYSPRSESMLGYTKDDDDYKHGVGDPKEMDKIRDEKQSKKEAEESADDLPHLRIALPKPAPEMPPMMPEEEEEPMMDDQFNEGQQFGAMTGMPDMGNLSIGNATGTMPAPGGMLATGEPMEDAWSSLLKEDHYHEHNIEETDEDVQQYFDEEVRPKVMNPDTPRPYATMDNGVLDTKVKRMVEGLENYDEDLLDEYNYRMVENDLNAQGSPVSNTGFDPTFQDVKRSEPMEDAWSTLMKRDVHPGSLAAYRQMVENSSPYEFDETYNDVNHLQDIPILDEKYRPHREADYTGNELMDLFAGPSVRDEMVGGMPFDVDDAVNAMRNEKVNLMREYDDVPDELIQDAREIDEPVFAEDIYDYVEESDAQNFPFYAGLQGKPMRRTYTPDMMGMSEMPTFAGIPFSEETGFTRSEPIEDAWSNLLKSRIDDMKGAKDQSWKQPQFKIQPGGADISTATSRRSKLHSRFLKPSKKRGLDKSPLAVHRTHLGIETKQPLRLFPRQYAQQTGTMSRRKLMGNVPVMPAGHAMGAESVYNPRAPSTAGSGGLPIREPRAPQLRGQALAKSELELIKEDIEQLKKKQDYMRFAQIRRLLRQLKDVAERQERRLKAAKQGGHGNNREAGHREGQDSTTRPEGATEDMENDPKNWGAPSTIFAARGSGRVG